MSKTNSNPTPSPQLFRKSLGGFAALAFAACSLVAQPPPAHQPAPVERRPQPQMPAAQYQNQNQRPAQYPDQQRMAPGSFGQNQNQLRPNPNGPVRPGQNQHLAQWMDTHRNLSLAQQQSALESEPGFHQLPPQEQQRMHQRLTQLNSMAPQQQQRVIERTEALERLPPAQRQQFRGAMAQLGNLPLDRRRAVARTFRAVSTMPEAQRQAYLNSPEYRSQFSNEERGTMTNLLNVAPMIPPRQQP